MIEPYKIIFDFLQGFEPEVSGRSAKPVPPEVHEQMCRFANGQLSETERQELQKSLEGNAEWVAALAKEVKALRETDDNHPAEG